MKHLKEGGGECTRWGCSCEVQVTYNASQVKGRCPKMQQERNKNINNLRGRGWINVSKGIKATLRDGGGVSRPGQRIYNTQMLLST